MPAEPDHRGDQQIARPADIQIHRQVEVLDQPIAGALRIRVRVSHRDQGARQPAAPHVVEQPGAPPGETSPRPIAEEVVADDEQPARLDVSGRGGEVPSGIGTVDERFDRERELGGSDRLREIEEVALQALDAAGQPGVLNVPCGELGLNAAQRDAGAPDDRVRSQEDQAVADAAAEVENVQRRRKGAGETLQFAKDQAIHVLKCLGLTRDALAPHGTVNGVRIARPREPPRRVQVVVVSNLFGSGRRARQDPARLRSVQGMKACHIRRARGRKSAERDCFRR